MTQVYNKTVIALYLDYIRSYLFGFYFENKNKTNTREYNPIQCNNWLIYGDTGINKYARRCDADASIVLIIDHYR